MARSCKLICTFALAVGLVAASAGAALASTLYVNGKTGKDTNPCTEPAAPCKTINAAVIKSEAIEGAATIEVAAGLYEEDVKLEKPADEGITINGAGDGGGGTEVVGMTGNKTVKISLPGGGATVSNLSVITPSGDEEAGITVDGNLTLDDVAVRMRDASTATGIESEEFGSVTINGGGVFMESGTKGSAITSRFVPLTLNDVEVAVASGATGGGVEDEGGSLSISNSSVSLAASSEASAIVGGIAPVSISNVSVVQAGKGSNAHAIELFLALPGSVSGVKVKMENTAAPAGAIVQALGTDSYEHVEVGGAWIGPAFQTEGGSASFYDSRLIAGPTDATPAVAYLGFDETPGLLLQRTVVQAPATASPGALEVLDGNATLDSSEVLGGASGVAFVQEAGKERRLTVAASTIDAGKPGVADGAGVYGVSVGVGGTASHANVLIEGSILLEGQLAEVGAGEKDEATITCKDSDAPSQTQAASGAAGAINCAAGSEGNTRSTPESLFATPITNYQLNPSSSAVDSVPTSEIKLPFGLTPSTTDLAGNPRSEDLDCVALQDKGALELQGRSTPCPVAVPILAPVSPKPVAGVITGLLISPSTFLAAPSGATVSAATAAKKKKYGATISYRDSQIATTTFTVLLKSSGRKQGKSCKKPSSKNKHGKRCTLLTKVGSFTHVDAAGANSLHFSGRIKGRKLAAGSYELQAVAHDAAGNGPTVTKSFTIK